MRFISTTTKHYEVNRAKHPYALNSKPVDGKAQADESPIYQTWPHSHDGMRIAAGFAFRAVKSLFDLKKAFVARHWGDMAGRCMLLMTASQSQSLRH